MKRLYTIIFSLLLIPSGFSLEKRTGTNYEKYTLLNTVRLRILAEILLEYPISVIPAKKQGRSFFERVALSEDEGKRLVSFLKSSKEARGSSELLEGYLKDKKESDLPAHLIIKELPPLYQPRLGSNDQKFFSKLQTLISEIEKAPQTIRSDNKLENIIPLIKYTTLPELIDPIAFNFYDIETKNIKEAPKPKSYMIPKNTQKSITSFLDSIYKDDSERYTTLKKITNIPLLFIERSLLYYPYNLAENKVMYVQTEHMNELLNNRSIDEVCIEKVYTGNGHSYDAFLIPAYIQDTQAFAATWIYLQYEALNGEDKIHKEKTSFDGNAKTIDSLLVELNKELNSHSIYISYKICSYTGKIRLASKGYYSFFNIHTGKYQDVYTDKSLEEKVKSIRDSLYPPIVTKDSIERDIRAFLDNQKDLQKVIEDYCGHEELERMMNGETITGRYVESTIRKLKNTCVSECLKEFNYIEPIDAFAPDPHIIECHDRCLEKYNDDQPSSSALASALQEMGFDPKAIGGSLIFKFHFNNSRFDPINIELKNEKNGEYLGMINLSTECLRNLVMNTNDDAFSWLKKNSNPIIVKDRIVPGSFADYWREKLNGVEESDDENTQDEADDNLE